jgi:tetratricopeptide (TPR) repeat protein
VLGPCLIATQGPAAGEAVTTFVRARELCERLGGPTESLQVMFWLATVSVVRGELPQALDAIAGLPNAAEAQGNRPALLNGIRGQGMILMFMGRPIEAREALERAVKLFGASEEADRLAARAAGQDAGVSMLVLMAWVFWILGQVDEAVARMIAALERADAVQHAHTQAYAWYYASVLYALRGEPDIAQTYAERCLAISEQHGFRQWLGLSRAVRGVCAAIRDASASRLDDVKAALDGYEGAGYQLGITAQFVLLCSTLLLRDDPEQVTEALKIIDHGLSIVSRNSECFFEAELYRLKGRALLMRGAPPSEAERFLDQALRTARSQQAQSLELRAATDLARLWMNQGKRAEARDVLESVHGRLSQGVDTRDHIAARAVLDQLQ